MKHAAVLSLLVAGLLGSAVALAEQSQKFGDTEVHYSAIPTVDLAPEVAKAYNLTRSKSRGLLTVSVLKKNKMGVAMPVTAQVSVNATNLSQQLANINMREVKESTAIYYLGEYRVTPPDTLTFSVTVKVPGEDTHSFDFQQPFYP